MIRGLAKRMGGGVLSAGNRYQRYQHGGGSGLLMSRAGHLVDRDVAIRHGMVHACVSLRAQVWGSMPVACRMVTPAPDGVGVGDVEARPLPVWLMSQHGHRNISLELAGQISASLDLHGNFFAEVIVSDGQPVSVIPLDPQLVQLAPNINYHDPKYLVTTDKELVEVGLWKPTTMDGEPSIIHIPGTRLPGSILGVSALDAARNGIGLAISSENYGSDFFNNGARPEYIIRFPVDTEVDADMIDTLKAGWIEKYGVKNGEARTPGFLAGGAMIETLTMSHDDAQFLETRLFQLEDIARVFGVPPVLVGLVTKSTSWGKGIEEQSIGFARYKLGPVIRKAESYLSGLLPPGEEICWDIDSLLRADVRTRYSTYVAGRAGGFLSGNDCRRLEGLPPVEGLDDYTSPAIASNVMGNDISNDEPDVDDDS